MSAFAGEHAWAQGWDPQPVWPHDGRTQAGMVFTTQHGGESTIWTLVRHEQAAIAKVTEEIGPPPSRG